MSTRPELPLTLRVSASAADSRRGIVRAHPDVIVALGMREWDAVEIVGSRTTGAVIAAARRNSARGLLLVDEVIAANCGLTDDSPVVARAARVTGAGVVTVQGLPAIGYDLPERVLRSAMLGKVLRVGDSVTLMPRDLGPDFPTADTSRTLRNRLGAAWGSHLLTVTATDPDGIVSVQPTTDVQVQGAARGDHRSMTTPASHATPGALGTPGGQGAPELQGTPGGQAAPGAPDRTSGATEHARPTNPHGIDYRDKADLVGTGDRAEVLEQWLHLALDRSDLLTSLGASSHLGVLVTGPTGVGKATLARAVVGSRPLELLDGPSNGAVESAARIEAVRRAVRAVTSSGGVLLVTDIDALLPAEPEPVSTLILDELREVVDTEGAALLATAVTSDDVDPRLRDPELCDRVLDLALPDAGDRAALLELLLRDVPTGEVDLAAVAAKTPGYVAGDLRALTREAAMRAATRATTDDDARDGDSRVEQEDLMGAVTVIRPLSRSGTEELSLGSITLDDVGDMAEVKQALTETVLWPLAHPDAFSRMGVQPSRGVLLYGPPGTGKTFVVRALAASGRLTVHMVKGAELMDKWVGSSEKAVRDLFQRARDSAPSLVFLDEIDALAPRRGQSADSGVGDRVVASLLTELDGAEPLEGVVVVGATNRPELIDPALLRPGRLERLVFVPPPDAEARAEILAAAGRDVPLSDTLSLDELAGELENYSAADCAALLREAALAALRRDIEATEVTAADIRTARENVRPSIDPVQVESLREYAQRRAE